MWRGVSLDLSVPAEAGRPLGARDTSVLSLQMGAGRMHVQARVSV